MNIPVPQNDLNREDDRGFVSVIGDLLRNCAYENSTWTEAKDLALRFAVPLFGMAAVGLWNHVYIYTFIR